MKTISKSLAVFFMVILAGLAFQSCSKIESLTNVKFNADLTGDLNVTISNGAQKSAVLSDTYSFSESVDVNLRSDPQIDKYFDKLKSFDVQSVTCTVNSVYGGPVNITNATLVIKSEAISATWYVKNFKLENGASLTLDNNNNQWDNVNTILNKKENFTISIKGTTDKDNVSFTLHVVIKTKVTANPL